MALVSPGVQVTVVDQSNYTPATTGSTAYILLATAQDKVAPGGTAYAAGTLAENASQLYNITSQRELVTTFGSPIFNTTASGAPLNGDELNEYGLLAAYSALGVSNNMYIQRADVDLSALQGTTIRPLNNPNNGTYWLNTATSTWGIYEWDAVANLFSQQSVTVISDTTYLTASNTVPTTNVGSIGSYAVNVYDATQPIYKKDRTNKWNLVGNTGWQQNTAVITSTAINTTFSANANANIVINTDTIGISSADSIANIAAAIESATDGSYRAWVTTAGQLAISVLANATSDGSTTDGILDISDGGAGTTLTQLGISTGTYNCAATFVGPYNQNPTWAGNVRAAGTTRPTGSVWHKSSSLGSGMNLDVREFNGSTLSWDTAAVTSYDTVSNATLGFDPTGGGTNITAGALWVDYLAYSNQVTNVAGTATLGTRLWYRKNTGATVLVGSTVTPTSPSNGDSFYVTVRANSSVATLTTYTVSITSGTASASGLCEAIVAADIPNVTAGLNTFGAVTITHSLGGDIFLQDVSGTPLADVGIDTNGTNIYAQDITGSTSLIGTNWAPLEDATYYYTSTQPYVAPANNTYWYYNSPSRIDIMYNNGTAWKGYGNVAADIRGYPLSTTNSTGAIVAASAPTAQDDGTALVYGDLWLDTSDLENWPALYRWQSVDTIDQWVALDKTDATSQNGVIFGDARWSTTGTVNPATATLPSIADLLTSDYVDFDAPDPTLYPKGILLVNTRASGYNVKQFKTSYFTQAAYPGEDLTGKSASTWLSASGYDDNNLPNFGRKAQRGVVVAALRAAIDSSTALREDGNQFNIMACPGYPELIPNMIALNNDRDNTAFIIGDTPMRLAATGTAIQAWVQNTATATATGETGLNTSDPYVGIYYPSGSSSDLSGATVIVPPSHAVLRSYLNSDNISYPWLAPAGTRRGLVDNLTSIGYIDSASGAFITTGVNQGLRDIMYANALNPITSLPGVGLVIYGQKTLSSTPSSLDRVNVSRLINYIRKQLNVLSKPFLFEPNDTITRNSVSSVVNSLLNDLVAKRGVADYLVVCDTTNNTPDRINRNELWVDIAVQPTKDVEFIYIPIRLVAAGQLTSNNVAPATAVGTGA